LTGLAVGGGLMYLLDPDRGTRRRALVRDKAVRATHVLRCAADKTGRDLQHRARGTVAELWSVLRSGNCSDDILTQRVRARLGRACSHPNSIEVHVAGGAVVLSGPVLESDADLLLREVRNVRGVKSVEDRLQHHQTAGDIPGLQGGSGRRLGQRFDLLQSRWAPATRLLAGAGGLVLCIRGLRRGGFIGIPEAVVGAGLLTRAATNLEFRRLFGVGETRSAIRMQKTINVHAPIEEVFHLWSNPENFARFMAHVKEVRKSSDGRLYHWTVAGPAGVSVAWDSEVTENVPNELIAWRTVPGSAMRNAGIVRFERNPDNGTRVHMLMSYNPPGGALGHVLASIFGSDPKAVMDEDLARMKSLLEVGKTRAHGERITRDQIA
jgi:uncharacterized membrane protein